MSKNLFKPSNLGEIIAERQLSILSTPDRDAIVKILLGKPEKLPDGPDFYCPFQIIGLGDRKVRCAYGIDAFQALQLAMTMIGPYLKSFSGSEAITLRWEGGEGGDLGFPMPD